MLKTSKSDLQTQIHNCLETQSEQVCSGTLSLHSWTWRVHSERRSPFPLNYASDPVPLADSLAHSPGFYGVADSIYLGDLFVDGFIEFNV
jgi:hypothetical protein